MNTRKWISLAALIVANTVQAAPQDNDFTLQNSNFPVITDPTSSSIMLDWRALCPVDQSLTDTVGCAPDCNRDSTAACSMLFRAGQVENFTGIPLPYLSTGVVVFKLTQASGAGTASVLNITLNQKPSNYGYMCEILNANGTPATLWNTTRPPIPTTVVTLDSNLSGPPFKSDSYVTTVSQPSGGVFNWYNNPNNPLYMVCLGYSVTESKTLQSNVACGGTSGTCVSYTLE
ncbi:MAG: hypothetical protein NTW08_02875 [Gammaproteobacteria bacterium]|nr:hypothetical protein [Gammaproteobacteria bacterium]